jgi:hypothetical protein
MFTDSAANFRKYTSRTLRSDIKTIKTRTFSGKRLEMLKYLKNLDWRDLAASAFVFVCLLVAFDPSQTNQTSPQARTRADSDNDRKTQIPFIVFSDVEMTAWATVIVALFTGTPFLATAGQYRQLRRSVDLARDEFNATHRPKIILHAVETATDVQSADSREPTIGASIIYFNVGDTPAFLTEIKAKISQYRLPLQSGLGIGIGVELAKLRVPSGEVIPGVPEYCAVTSRHTEDSVRFAARAAHGRGHESALVLIGKISYRDGLGITRETGFCRKLDLGAFPFQAGQPGTPRWVPLKDHPEYEYAY